MFELHPQLAADCIEIGELPLCRALLMDDAHYPWVILVPRRPDIREVFQLSPADRHTLSEESAHTAQAMNVLFNADKMNIAALGNQVPQLHIHHIARFSNDPAWPAPVWGKLPRQPYTNAEKGTLVRRLQGALSSLLLPQRTA